MFYKFPRTNLRVKTAPTHVMMVRAALSLKSALVFMMPRAGLRLKAVRADVAVPPGCCRGRHLEKGLRGGSKERP